MTPRSRIYHSLPPSAPGMRIGLLGGSFNPPHAGHRHLSVQALKRLALHRVWWVVTPGNPLKNHDELASLDQRLNEAARAADHPRLVMTGFESEWGSPYTHDTLTRLCRSRPGVRFVWLMGADNLVDFHHWRGWRHIAGLVPLAVAHRPGWRYAALASRAATVFARRRFDEAGASLLALARPPAWAYLNVRPSDESSTEIRNQSAQ